MFRNTHRAFGCSRTLAKIIELCFSGLGARRQGLGTTSVRWRNVTYICENSLSEHCCYSIIESFGICFLWTMQQLVSQILFLFYWIWALFWWPEQQEQFGNSFEVLWESTREKADRNQWDCYLNEPSSRILMAKQNCLLGLLIKRKKINPEDYSGVLPITGLITGAFGLH